MTREPSPYALKTAREVWRQMFPPAKDWHRVKPGDRIEIIARAIDAAFPGHCPNCGFNLDQYAPGKNSILRAEY